MCTHRVSGGVVHITRGARAASTDSKSMDGTHAKAKGSSGASTQKVRKNTYEDRLDDGAFVNVLKSSMQPQLSGTSVGDNSNTKKPSQSQK